MILTMCHASGLVHRDVKPDNIVLADGAHRRPVLLDFGLNFHEGAEPAQVTGFMAPTAAAIADPAIALGVTSVLITRW